MDQLDETSGIKFGDLQREERYQKLKRKLKLAFIKQLENKKYNETKELCTSPTWPSISSIADQIDSSFAGPSLQVSKIGSEVVSSSAKLKKMLPHQKSENYPTATSSVKSFYTKKNNFDDQMAMPPPSSTRKLILQNKKESSQLNTKNIHSTNRGNTNIPSSVDVDISIIKKSSDDINSGARFQEANSSYYQSDSQDSQNIRVFSRWRVLINNQRQLIVKGTLECGRIARSKPVIQRLSATSVQSIYKHTYILKGNIVDENNTLPDYVRGKFHNGFPDDWENVCQIWRNYIDSKCQLTFRWPTPITDSDDDLQSEISEMPKHSKNSSKAQQEKVPRPSSDAKDSRSSSGYHSIAPSTSKIDDFIPENQTCDMSKEESAKEHAVVSEPKTGNDKCQSNTGNSEKFTFELCHSGYLSEIIKDDKLAIIIRNITTKNCPLSYLNKVLELFSCLRDISSFKMDDDNHEGEKSECSFYKNASSDCHKCSKSMSEEPLNEVLNTNLTIDPKGIQSEQFNENLIDYQHKPLELENQKNVENNHEQSEVFLISLSDDEKNDISESETYTGVPKISAIKLLQSRASDQNFQRYNSHRKRRRTCNEFGNTTHVVKTQPNKILTVSNDNYDSSVSITEDEVGKSCNENVYKQHKILEEECVLKPNNDSKSKILLGNVNESNKLPQRNSFCELPTGTSNVFKTPISRISNDNLFSGDKENVEINYLESQVQETMRLSDLRKSCHKDERINSMIVSRAKPVIRSCEIIIPKLVQQKITIESVGPQNTNDISKNVKMNTEAQNKIEDPNKSKFSRTSQQNDKKLNAIVKNTEENEKQKAATPAVELQLRPKDKRNVQMSDKKKFGSQENPKMLTSWVPLVEFDEASEIDSGLKFEGNLLNEAGHIIHRKFVTNFIFKRLSSVLIETIDHEFFQLVGEISDTKHIVPKDLLKQCRSGCPKKMNNFCSLWKSYKRGSDKVQAYNSSIQSVNVSVSSRGRCILPCLNYWNGEAIRVIDNNPIYQPGNSGESALSSSSKNLSYTTISESKDISTDRKESQEENSSNKSSKKNRPSKNTETVQEKVLPKMVTRSSNDDCHDKRLKRTSEASKKHSHGQHLCNEDSHVDCKLRKRQRTQNNDQSPNSRSSLKQTLLINKQQMPDLKWSYKKRASGIDNGLSDDQISVILK